jgi:hypothetical protein
LLSLKHEQISFFFSYLWSVIKTGLAAARSNDGIVISLLSRQLPGILLSSSFLLFAEHVNAASGNSVTVGAITSFNLGTWEDSGNVTASQVSCITSENTGNGRQYSYWVKVDSLDTIGAFALYRNGDPSGPASSTLAVSFKHRDTVYASSIETLVPGDYESDSHSGGTSGCSVDGANSELTIEISASELASKTLGYYEGNFELTGMGGVNANQNASTSFSVSVTIEGASQQVKISRLDDLSFGAYSGTGSRQASERFCVYSTAGSYRLSVSSASQDSSGNFYLPSVNSSANIPVAVSFIDSIGGPGTIPVLNAAVSGLGDSNSEDCLGTDNATLTFDMNEQSLRSVASGDYLETLTIMIEPE